MITAVSLNRSALKRYIKQSGLTHIAISKMVPCSSVMISRWVHGQSKITKKKLVGLARTLNCHPMDLLKGPEKQVREYSEDLIAKYMIDKRNDDDLPEIDEATFIQLAKNLGYLGNIGGSNSGGQTDVGFDQPETDAEKQMGDLFDG